MSDRINRHGKNRMLVCGVCFRKPRHSQMISPLVHQLIKTHYYKDYSLDDISLPLVCCKSCVKALKSIDSGKGNRKLPDFAFGSLI